MKFSMIALLYKTTTNGQGCSGFDLLQDPKPNLRDQSAVLIRF